MLIISLQLFSNFNDTVGCVHHVVQCKAQLDFSSMNETLSSLQGMFKFCFFILFSAFFYYQFLNFEWLKKAYSEILSISLSELDLYCYLRLYLMASRFICVFTFNVNLCNVKQDSIHAYITFILVLNIHFVSLLLM